jgi:hypothetical protein
LKGQTFVRIFSKDYDQKKIIYLVIKILNKIKEDSIKVSGKTSEIKSTINEAKKKVGQNFH